MNYDYDGQETGRKKTEGMKVLIVEPLKEPYLKTISGDLRSLQNIVGGHIDATYPFKDPVAIVLNDEGKMNGMMPNRGLYDDKGNLYDIVAGTFLIAGLTEDDFGTLSEELSAKYMEKFKVPEMPVRINGQMAMVPMPEQMRGKTAQAEKDSARVEMEFKTGQCRNSRTNQNRKIRKRSRANEGR